MDGMDDLIEKAYEGLTEEQKKFIDGMEMARSEIRSFSESDFGLAEMLENDDGITSDLLTQIMQEIALSTLRAVDARINEQECNFISDFETHNFNSKEN